MVDTKPMIVALKIQKSYPFYYMAVKEYISPSIVLESGEDPIYFASKRIHLYDIPNVMDVSQRLTTSNYPHITIVSTLGLSRDYVIYI